MSKITIDFYSECLTGNAHADLVETAYTPETMYSLGMEAGRAVQAMETVWYSETMRIQSLANKSEEAIIMVAEGLFDKGGFFSNIWATITAAFRKVADFIGGLFGKLTGATEKNLQALKDAWVLLRDDSKFKKLTSGQDTSASLKKGSTIKVPKNAVASPLLVATIEADVAMSDKREQTDEKGDLTGGSQLYTLEFGGNKLWTYFTKTLKDATSKLQDAGSFQKDSVNGQNISDVTRKIMEGNGRTRMTEAEKLVKIKIADFVKTIIAGVTGDNSTLGGVTLPSQYKLQVLTSTNPNTTVDLYRKVDGTPIINDYLANKDVSGNLKSIFGFIGDYKSVNKPEDVADIKNYFVEKAKIEGTATLTDKEIIDFLKLIGSLYTLAIERNDVYENLKKFFNDGRTKFTELADKYQDIANEFKSTVEKTSDMNIGNSDASDNANKTEARNAASTLRGTVSDTDGVVKIASFFTQLSLKWYSTVDALLTVGIANFYNLIKIAKDALDKNVIETV